MAQKRGGNTLPHTGTKGEKNGVKLGVLDTAPKA
jgi:hypothetical protein